MGIEQAVIKTAALRVSSSARLRLYSSLMRRSMAFHNECQPGELLSRLTNDSDAVASASTHVVTAIKGDCFIFLSFCVIFFFCP